MRNNGAPLKLVMKKMHRHAAPTIHKYKRTKNSANPTQNPIFSLYLADYPRVALCMVWSENPTQTLH